MVCPHGQGVGQGEKGVNFLRFCVDVFYGRPLMMKKVISSFLTFFIKLMYQIYDSICQLI